MAIAITDEQRAVQAAIRQWATRADPLRAARAQEPPPPAATPSPSARNRLREVSSEAETSRNGLPAPGVAAWAGLVDVGLFGIGLPVRLGGGGGSVVELAAGLEETAAALAPGPLLPTALAGVLLAVHSDTPAGKEWLPRLATGQATVAVALDPPETPAATEPTAAVGRVGRLDGVTGPVLGAGETTHVLLPTAAGTWCLLDADHPGVTVDRLDPVDFSRALATLRLDAVSVPPERCFAGPDLARARNLAATLYAAEAVGVAAWCLRTATEYAKVRRQFGRPVGSFQAVKHLCAGMLCRVERAAAVAWDAARAADEPEQHPIAAAVAAAVALDAAVDNAKDCIQVLGGIGFTWEHDAHLYLRRALALRQLLGGSAAWRRRAAELALGGVRRRLRVAAADPSPEVRATVDEIAGLPEGERRRALADCGYLAPHWPAPYGLDATPELQLMIDGELARVGVDRPDLGIGGWAVPTILRHGEQAQRIRFARPTLRGEITWCQLFSEPEAGSDLASLRTRAERVGGGWRLTGQKVWTSLARQADWAICLARTDPGVPKHKGITYFLVAMDSPGIEVRPLREITGEAVFNEVFLDDVFVPDDCVVGAPGEGWRLARATLANERVAMGGGPALGELVEELLSLARDRGVERESLGALVADGAALSLLGLRETLRRLDGQDPGPESGVRKLVGVAHRQAVAEYALVLAGPEGAVDGPPVRQFLLTRCLSIAGGTTQVLLSLAAERILGLPRE